MLNKYIISIHSSKKSVYIFCKDGACIDCKSIYEECLMYLQTQGYNKGVNQESNTQTNTEVSITLEELQSYKPSLFFYSTLLLGSSEIETNPFLFGQLDKDNTIKQDTPTYHFSPKDEENNLGTLTIFLNSCTLTLLNYSLLDSSLNIKLEYNSKESKAILEREQIQREQIQRDSNSIDSLTSTAMLHPILEDDEIKCPHNGVVKLKSNKGKPFTSKGIPMILESDLLHSSIIGCTNNTLTSDSKTFSTNQCIIPKNRTANAS